MTEQEIRADVERVVDDLIHHEASLDRYSPDRERQRVRNILLAAHKRWIAKAMPATTI